MLRLIIFLFLSSGALAQMLPKHDNGISISFNYSQRNIPDFYYSQKPIMYPNVHFKKNINFKNHFSFKTGASLFITGFKYDVPGDKIYGYNYNPNDHVEYGTSTYLCVPAMLSYNYRKFFVDIGGGPCFKFRSSAGTGGKGDGIEKARLTHTFETHLGYYIPLKKRRLFIESAFYISEIQANILLPHSLYYAYYVNDYTYNLQFSVGFMFNKSE